MRTIKILVATTNETEDPFTLDQLTKLSDSAESVPIVMGFEFNKVIGKVIGAVVTKDGLVITCDIETGNTFSQYLVPGYLFPSYECVCFGVVSNPADKTLQPIQL